MQSNTSRWSSHSLCVHSALHMQRVARSANGMVRPRSCPASQRRAQGRPRRIGFLGAWADEPARDPVHAARLRGLREKGWIEGKNLLVEYRYAPDRLPALAAELVALTPELIIASGPQPAQALKSATATIPIVFVAVFDPVGLGLVQSLSRPGGNITGLATYVPGNFVAKRIEILRELVPDASKIAILVNPRNPMHRLLLAEEVPSSCGIEMSQRYPYRLAVGCQRSCLDRRGGGEPNVDGRQKGKRVTSTSCSLKCRPAQQNFLKKTKGNGRGFRRIDGRLGRPAGSIVPRRDEGSKAGGAAMQIKADTFAADLRPVSLVSAVAACKACFQSI